MKSRNIAGILIVPSNVSSNHQLKELRAPGVPIVMLDPSRLFPSLYTPSRSTEDSVNRRLLPLESSAELSRAISVNIRHLTEGRITTALRFGRDDKV